MQGGVSVGRFLAELYVLFTLFFGGLSGTAAIARGLPPISSFFFGLGLSVFGYVYVLARPSQRVSRSVSADLVKVPVTQSPFACPQCGNTNHPAAAACAARQHPKSVPKDREELTSCRDLI